MTAIRLKKKEARRVLRGHPWIFSNEIEDLPRTLAPGSLVDVVDYTGRFIGRAYFNPHSLIAARILTRTNEDVSYEFFLRRIRGARDLRVSLGFVDSFRAVYSEADGLPGLIVDKYGPVLVVQSLTAGFENRLDPVLAALNETYAPAAVLLRNDSPSRLLEALPLEKRLASGSLPDPLVIDESGIRYVVDVGEGQKTGFFFDQRENRLALKPYVAGRRTLDCFCYIGAWSLSAARFGASSVLGIDSSQKAVALARQNASLNELPAQFRVADVFDELKGLERSRERFGCIILDPPAFAKSRAKVREALKGYKELNARAFRLLEPRGILVTCSCSHHVDDALFREMLIDAASSAGRNVTLLEWRTQSRDHPILLAMRETQYLKCAVLMAE